MTFMRIASLPHILKEITSFYGPCLSAVVILTISVQTLRDHTGSVASVRLSANGARLYSGSGDKAIKVWDTATGNCVQTLQGHTDIVNSVCLSAVSAARSTACSPTRVRTRPRPALVLAAMRVCQVPRADE